MTFRARQANAHGFAGSALHVLQRVTESTREATILGILDGDQQLTVQKVDGPQQFRLTSDPGAHGPLHATSMGKVLIAFTPPAESKRLLDELDLPALGPNTITDRDQLRREIEKVRRRGYAVQDEENEAGMRAVSVPVLGPQGVAMAAVATAAPIFRLTTDDLTALVPLLKEAAAELAVRLPLR